MTVAEPRPGLLDGSSGALRLLAYGSPLGRTLEAAANIAASAEPPVGCAILLVTDEHLTIAASHRLVGSDQQLLKEACALPVDECLEELERQIGVTVRLLVTSAAELIGAVALFASPLDLQDARVYERLDEVSAISTLAIEGKHLLDELYFRAHHDPLTNVWNRLWMEGEISRTLAEASQNGSTTGLILLGIDSFRNINELLGLEVGNELMQAIVARLTLAMKPGWSLARWGGDQFVILIPALASPEQMKDDATELLGMFDRPFEFEEHELMIRASVGTSFATAYECCADDLQNRAETALRYGKRLARGRVTAFTPAMITTPPERLEMERHLRFALQKREFEVHYQPQIHLQSGRLVGVEALLRWRHPSLGYISPGSFVPVAEQIGIIDEIGTWVLEQAIGQLEEWNRAGLSNLRIAVNVSALQFLREDFASRVARCLRRSSINPSDLELEITETAVMTDFEHCSRQLRLLRSLGVLAALDDFGTGHSSLACLQQLPIQRLKIDRMFLNDLGTEAKEHPLLSGIIQMGRALNCSVIAEGIETPEQAIALAALNCEEAQGFLFSKALPAPDLLRWARRHAKELPLLA